MFDEKRIISNQSAEYEFFVELCKQEFAHTMISMIKEISYPEFDKELADLEIGREQVSA